MKIRKRLLGHIEKVYSLALITNPNGTGLPTFAAGSEADGELLLFKPPKYEPLTIARKPGGFISLFPFYKNGQTFLLASTDFKPGFNAENCRILKYPLDRGECPEPAVVSALPYTHRIAVATVGGKFCLLASTLCSSKSFKGDWSHPGGVHFSVIPDDPNQPWTFRQIAGNLSKNHGMDFARLQTETSGGFLLSATEGLFYLCIPNDATEPWPMDRIATGEYSDAFAYDWNRFGSSDIFTISPFHGNVLSMFTRFKNGWDKVTIDDGLEFGHVIWAGDLLGKPGLLVGERGGSKELRLYRSGPSGFHSETIDEGIGPAQMLVLNDRQDFAQLVVSAHARDEVLLYNIGGK